MHKELFPMNIFDCWGMIFCFFWLIFVNAGGIGGGGSMIIICLSFFSFQQKQAIAISNMSVFVSSLVRYLINSRKTHPLKNGKGLLVDINYMIVMLPMIVSGVSFCIIANIASPDPVIIGALVVITSFSSVSLALKFRVLYLKENYEKEEELKQLEMKEKKNQLLGEKKNTMTKSI